MSEEMSVDEIIAYLTHSALKTVLVEGKFDATVIRTIDRSVSGYGADVFPCGGRDKLLAVFVRRSECGRATIAFLADRDMWYFDEVPAEYRRGIVFTAGYSIENDMYCEDWVHRIMSDPTERREFDGLIKVIVSWFAAEVDRVSDGQEPRCNVSVHTILDESRTRLCPNFVSRCGEPNPRPQTVERIYAEYPLALRGKNLLEAVHIVLSKPGRHARWSKESIVEALVREGSSKWAELMNRLLQSLQGMGCEGQSDLG